MAYRIPVYIPNISTEKIIELLSNNLNVDGSIVDFELLEKGAKFRAPGMALIVNTEENGSDHLESVNQQSSMLSAKDELRLTRVIQVLIKAARVLGATQFSFEHEGFDMRLRPTSLSDQQIAHLLIASRTFKIDQINIF